MTYFENNIEFCKLSNSSILSLWRYLNKENWCFVGTFLIYPFASKDLLFDIDKPILLYKPIKWLGKFGNSILVILLGTDPFSIFDLDYVAY